MLYINFKSSYTVEECRLMGSRSCSFVRYLVLITALSALYEMRRGRCLQIFPRRLKLSRSFYLFGGVNKYKCFSVVVFEIGGGHNTVDLPTWHWIDRKEIKNENS